MMATNTCIRKQTRRTEPKTRSRLMIWSKIHVQIWHSWYTSAPFVSWMKTWSDQHWGGMGYLTQSNRRTRWEGWRQLYVYLLCTPTRKNIKNSTIHLKVIDITVSPLYRPVTKISICKERLSDLSQLLQKSRSESWRPDVRTCSVQDEQWKERRFWLVKMFHRPRVVQQRMEEAAASEYLFVTPGPIYTCEPVWPSGKALGW